MNETVEVGLAEDREDDTVEKKVPLTHKKKAFRNMLEMREELTYPKDFDYKKAVEEVVDEKYNFTN